MPDTFRIGPARILVASSITEPVENWTDLGITRGDVAVEPRVRIAVGRPDQTAATPRSDAVYRVGEIATTRAPMLDKALILLQKQYPASAIVTASGKTSLALDNKIGAVSGVAIAVVPIDVYVEGQAWWASDYTVWIPSGIFRVGGDLKHELPAEGDDGVAASVREVEIVSTRSAAGVPASVQGAGGIGQLWLNGLGALGLDLLLEHSLDSGTTPLIGAPLTFTRGSSAVEKSRADGKYRSVANDIIRDEAEGFRIEPQRTNKCWRNYLHGGATTGWAKGGDAAATLTAVADAAELAAAGLNVLCADNSVLKLDNTAGVADAWAQNSGVTGNTNKHTASVFIRGTGNAQMGLSGAQAAQFALAAAYQRVANTLTPTNAANSPIVTAKAGAVVYFILFQMEEGEILTNPIPNNTDGSVSRSGDMWSKTYTTGIDTVNGLTMQVAFRPVFAGGAVHTGVVIQCGLGAGATFSLLHASGNGYQLYLQNDLNATGDLNGENVPANAESELTVVWDPALAKRWAAYQVDADVTPVASASAVNISIGTWTGAILLIGRDSSNQIGAHFKRIAVCRGNVAALLLRKLKRS